MCGRFALYAARMSPEEFEARFGFPMPMRFRDPFSYNIGPYRDIPVIVRDRDGAPQMREMFWQLIPAFAKEFKSQYSMFNTRDDSFEKRTFKQNLLRHSRCLIPANHFYEWEKAAGGKLPWLFETTDQALFTFGGIFSIWKSPEGEARFSCSIITVPANAVVAAVHPRMPFILPRESEALWLDREITDFARLRSMLQPYPTETMRARRVPTLVNNIRHDGPELIEDEP